MLPPVPEENYYLHDVPSDMEALIDQYIAPHYSEEKIERYWKKAFNEESSIDHELKLVEVPIDMIQEPLIITESQLRRLGFFQKVGNLPPLLVNGNRFVDGRHRLNTYELLGEEKFVAIDLNDSGIDVRIPDSECSIMY